jgi:hypothetical protein
LRPILLAKCCQSENAGGEDAHRYCLSASLKSWLRLFRNKAPLAGTTEL